MSIRTDLKRVADTHWFNDRVFIDPIKTEDDLIYALFDCRLADEQKELVNPASFSVGRAYLYREDNYPCIIRDERKTPIGFINLCKWLADGDAYSWSFFIDEKYQGKGYGRSAARLAIHILKTANPAKPVKLSTEENNEKAQRLYISLGFKKLDELDGDDFVFEL